MIERLLPLFATLLARTLRIRWSGEKLPERAILMFWHGKMFVGWYAVRKRRPVALVSASKDGNILAAVLAHWGYKLSRGSSKKSGMQALQQAMQRIEKDECNALVITPDGPRGPRRIFKRGAFLAAKELNVPLYFLHIEYRSHRTLRSWDRFEVPMPFTQVTIRAEQIPVDHFPIEREEQEDWLANCSRSYDSENASH